MSEEHRPLPSSLEAEKGVLSSVFLDPDCLDSLQDMTGKFHHPAHETVWKCMSGMRAKKQPIDLITVTQELADRKLLEQIGGAAFLTELGLFLPTGSQVNYYADKVLDKWRRRETIRLTEEIGKSAYENQAQSAGDLLSDGLSSLKALRDSAAQEGDKLEARRFDVANPPAPAVPLLSLSGQTVCTAGNLAAIVGQAKSGKSAILGAIIASSLDHSRHLHFEAPKVEGAKGVLHFDTEQSRYDHHQLVRRAMWRAGVSTVPEWFQSYSLADIPTGERRELLATTMSRMAKSPDGLRQVLIDGVADLCHDPNDPPEAIELVDELHRNAIRFNCSILCVLHHNPGTEKSRGHLGSQLDRKSESVVALEKDSEGAITIYLQHPRHGFLPKKDGPRIGWSDEEECFVELEKSKREVRTAEKAKEDLKKSRELARVLFREGAKSHSKITATIMKLRGVSKRTAERAIEKMTVTNVITKNLLGDYEINREEDEAALP